VAAARARPVAYLSTTIFLLVVMALGYAGIGYGGAPCGFLFLAESRGSGAGFALALITWAGVIAIVAHLLNALIGARVERRYTQLSGAILFAGSWYGLHNVHNTPAVVVLYLVQNIGIVLWLAAAHARVHSRIRFITIPARSSPLSWSGSPGSQRRRALEELAR
jgi:hypothetical protein